MRSLAIVWTDCVCGLTAFAIPLTIDPLTVCRCDACLCSAAQRSVDFCSATGSTNACDSAFWFAAGKECGEESKPSRLFK